MLFSVSRTAALRQHTVVHKTSATLILFQDIAKSSHSESNINIFLLLTQGVQLSMFSLHNFCFHVLHINYYPLSSFDGNACSVYNKHTLPYGCRKLINSHVIRVHLKNQLTEPFISLLCTCEVNEARLRHNSGVAWLLNG